MFGKRVRPPQQVKIGLAGDPGAKPALPRNCKANALSYELLTLINSVVLGLVTVPLCGMGRPGQQDLPSQETGAN